VSLLVGKVQTAQLARATTQQVNAVVDPLEASIEVPIPGREFFDSDDADWDGEVGGEDDTADVPAAAINKAVVASGEPPAAEVSITLPANQPIGMPHRLAGGTPHAGSADHAPGSPESVPANRRVSSPDSLAAPAESTGSGLQDSVTQSGILVGTPMYMAPELWHSGSHLAQPSSDLFSFGVIAFELLTSVLPFLQPPVFAYAQKQPMRIAQLGSSRSELDPRLSALVDACLSATPSARPTARLVVQRLRELGAPTPMV
jgi:serine/threonine protein kinase